MSRSLPTRIVGRLRHREDPPAPRLRLDSGFRERETGEAPIFVIGCFRSGTSLVRRILDSHSRIACPAESKFLLPLAGLLADRTVTRGLQGMGFEREDVVAEVADFAARFFATYAASRGKARWADKTPDYADCLDELWEMFGPDVRFVIIHRHGMDVAVSLSDPHRRYPAIRQHLDLAGGDTEVAAAMFWAEKTAKIEAFRASHPEVCHEIRYEALTTDPEGTLRPMFEFLGEPWEPAVLDYQGFEHHRGLEDPDVHRRSSIVPNSGRYRAWPPERLEAVRAACEPMLSRLGYA